MTSRSSSRRTRSTSRADPIARRTIPAGVALLAALAVARPSAAEEVAPGVTYTAQGGHHVLVVDLDSDAVQVRVNHPEAAAGADFKTVSAHAAAHGAIAAINANYFDLNKGGACGAARGFGEHFTRYYAEPPNCVTTLGWARAQGDLFSCEGHEGDATFRPELTELVTGGGTLLYSGSASWSQLNMPVGRAMTAAGISADRKQLVLLVTDKGLSQVSGMQQTLQAHGASDAVFLDGGGSTRMWIDGKGYVNLAEGGDRSVPVVILVLPGAAPRPDAGLPEPDAGAPWPDAGPEADAAADAGAPAGDASVAPPGDAGVPPATPPSDLSGGCAIPPHGAPRPWALVALLPLLLFRRRGARARG